MTVSAGKMLKRQVVLMTGKRFRTVRYAGVGEGGPTEKTRAWGMGDVSTKLNKKCPKTERTSKKGGYESKNVRKISKKIEVSS